MTKRAVKFSAMLLGAALLSACVGVREHRGFVLDEQLAQSVQVGVDNKESVTKTLGRPTFVGQFDPNDWYYLSQDTHQFAFRDPRVTEQTLLHVRFDPAGNVAQVGDDRQGIDRLGRPGRRLHPDAGPQAQLLRRTVRQYRHDRAAGPAGRATRSQ